MIIEQPPTIDLLDVDAPALSSTSDLPVVETKPDASNEGAPPAVPSEQSEEAKQPEESATSATEDQPGQPAAEEKAPRGVGKKIQELTRRSDEAARRAEAAEARLDRLMAAMERMSVQAPAQPEAQQVSDDPEPAKPVRSEYDADGYDQAILEYADAKAAWIARKELRAAQEKAAADQQADAIASKREAVREAYQARVEAVKEKYPDFTEVAESPDVQVSMPMAAAILHSDHGPDLQYWLGANPQEAARIIKLSPPLQLMELGKIEARLTAPRTPKPAVSAAPAPIKPISGSASGMQKSPEDMSMDEYAAWRKGQQAQARARH